MQSMEPRIKNISSLPLGMDLEWQEVCVGGEMNKIYLKNFQHSPLCYAAMGLLIG